MDCFEIFIERLSILIARAMTWSSYKHHNTAKVLLGITPQGVVSFVSDCWGRWVSDKNLLPGDIVLADREFDITESVGTMQARLHIPAFTKGKSQLTAAEIEALLMFQYMWNMLYVPPRKEKSPLVLITLCGFVVHV